MMANNLQLLNFNEKRTGSIIFPLWGQQYTVNHKKWYLEIKHISPKTLSLYSLFFTWLAHSLKHV